MLNFYNTKVTLELRDLVENGVDIWDFQYPSYYNGEAKTAFEQKVIDHFYFRQIGQETAGRFLHMFRARVREIMPYYLQLYKTEQIMAEIEDPFGNVDITETFEEQTTGTKSGESESESSGETTTSNSQNSSATRKHSNTPQGSIENLDNYMSEATADSSTGSENASADTTARSSGTSNETAENTTTRTVHRKGNHGVNTYAHDMIEFRQTLLNIDALIIADLSCLFLGVY